MVSCALQGVQVGFGGYLAHFLQGVMLAVCYLIIMTFSLWLALGLLPNDAGQPKRVPFFATACLAVRRCRL